MYNIDEENSEILFEVVGENIVLKLKNISGSGLNTPIYILKSYDATIPTENNVFSSLKVLSLLDQQKSTLDPVFEIKTNTDGTKTVHVKGNLYTDGGLSALGDNTISGGGTASGIDYEALQALFTGNTNAYDINLAFLSAINQSYITSKISGLYADKNHAHNVSDLNNDAGYITTSSLSNYALKTYVDNKVAAIVNSAPSALDTLNELSAALGNDPNFATSMSTLIGTKWTQDNAKIANWDAAYSWGDHKLAGYLSASVLNDIFEITTADGVKTLRIKGNAYTDGGLSALGNNTVTGGGTTGLDYDALRTLLEGSVNAYTINAAFLGAIDKSYITNKLGTEYSLSTHGHNLSALTNDAGFICTNDSRLYDARVASDVYTWAKASVKPSYSFSEIRSKPTTLNGYGITDALLASSYNASDILTKLKTVDGTGSGLDADLLDGYHATSLYRTDNANLSTIDWNAKELHAYGDLLINDKRAIRGFDSWLRINDLGHFTDGIYCGNSLFRTDGVFQVGDSGSKFIVGASGNIGIGTTTPQGKLDVAGTGRFTGLLNANSGIQIGSAQLIYNAANNTLRVQKYDGTAVDFYATGGVSSLGAGTVGSTSYISAILNVSNDIYSGGNVYLNNEMYLRGKSTTGTYYQLFGVDSSNYVKYGDIALESIFKGAVVLISTASKTNIIALYDKVFLNANTEITGTITSTGSGTFNGGSFSSLRSLKDVHDDWKGSALNAISEFKVRDFNYKNDITNRTLGFIIDEVPEDVANYVLFGKDKDSINLYTLHALSFKAHQETKSEIDILKDKITCLEREVSQLRKQLN